MPQQRKRRPVIGVDDPNRAELVKLLQLERQHEEPSTQIRRQRAFLKRLDRIIEKSLPALKAQEANYVPLEIQEEAFNSIAGILDTFLQRMERLSRIPQDATKAPLELRAQQYFWRQIQDEVLVHRNSASEDHEIEDLSELDQIKAIAINEKDIGYFDNIGHDALMHLVKRHLAAAKRLQQDYRKQRTQGVRARIRRETGTRDNFIRALARLWMEFAKRPQLSGDKKSRFRKFVVSAYRLSGETRAPSEQSIKLALIPILAKSYRQ